MLADAKGICHLEQCVTQGCSIHERREARAAVQPGILPRSLPRVRLVELRQ
jgi:hypothetical protein